MAVVFCTRARSIIIRIIFIIITIIIFTNIRALDETRYTRFGRYIIDIIEAYPFSQHKTLLAPTIENLKRHYFYNP